METEAHIYIYLAEVRRIKRIGRILGVILTTVAVVSDFMMDLCSVAKVNRVGCFCILKPSSGDCKIGFPLPENPMAVSELLRENSTSIFFLRVDKSCFQCLRFDFADSITLKTKSIHY